MDKIKKLSYSFGAVATALSYQAFSTYILFFYVDYIKLGAHLAALGMLIWAIWNAVNDPVMGFISDRTRTRFGRRIPYILFGAIPFGLAYFLLWVPPFDPLNQQILLFLYFLAFICLFDLGYTTVVLNWAALFPEMYTTLKERAQVNSYRQSFGMVGLILGIALPPLIYSTWGWKWMGLAFGVLIALAYHTSLFGSKEKGFYLKEKALGLKAAFKNTLINRSFLTFVFSNLFIQFAFTMVLAMIPFYAKYILRANEVQTSLILFSAFAVAIPMMFVWRKLVTLFGAKRTYLAAILIQTGAVFLFMVIKDLQGGIFASACMGLGLSGIILLSDVLISDVIDEDELKTKTRREGMYFGVNAFVTRFAIALEAACIGPVFLLTHYNPYVFTQTPEFLLGLRILISGLPIAALFLAFVIMRLYPLDRERLKEISPALESLHAEKGINRG